MVARFDAIEGGASSIEIGKKILSRIPRKLKIQMVGVFCLALLVSAAQLVVVGCVALLGSAVASPGTLMTSGVVQSAIRWVPEIQELDSKAMLIGIAVMSAVAIFCVNGLKLLYGFVSARLSNRVAKSVGGAMLEGILALPYQWILWKNSADLQMVMSWNKHYGLVILGAMRGACDLLTGLGLLVLVSFGVSWVTFLVAAGAFLFLMCLHKISKKYIDQLGQKLTDVSLRQNRVVLTAFQGMGEVKFFSREKSLVDAYTHEAWELVNHHSLLAMAVMIPPLSLEAVGFSVVCVVIVFMLINSASVAALAGGTALIVAVAWRLLPCLSSLLSSINGIRTGWPLIAKCEALFDDFARHHVVLGDLVGYKPYEKDWQLLNVANVDFTYKGKSTAALQSINMPIKKGMALGVVGHSGAGKSTLVSLICGLFAPTSGALEVDGVPASVSAGGRLKLPTIGYVSQSPYVFDGTLAENIAFGFFNDAIDMEHIRYCCKMAHMDFLDDLPEGLNTRIGERGMRLSGGQRQRVSIARALYTRPEIIVLDEATSSLDTKSERAILKAIYALKGEITLIMVAHRLSTVAKCDMVYWLDKGNIRKSGTPEEIIPEYSDTMLNDKSKEQDDCF